ncbi:hypothetical protein CSC82_19450 [Rhodobacteraceae bacterium 4F10]|nr:hypothetical protein CSC82_19450 [Rhodobacteraceae bacterium 4F10]
MVFRIDRRITSCRNVFTRLLNALPFAWGAASMASSQDHPNILMVMADDMGFLISAPMAAKLRRLSDVSVYVSKYGSLIRGI